MSGIMRQWYIGIRKLKCGARIQALVIFICLVGCLSYIHYNCMIGLSDHCTDRTVLVSTPLNKSPAENAINAIANEIQLKRMAGKKEKDDIQHRREEITIASHSDSISHQTLAAKEAQCILARPDVPDDMCLGEKALSENVTRWITLQLEKSTDPSSFLNTSYPLPTTGGYTCRNRVCSELLSPPMINKYSRFTRNAIRSVLSKPNSTMADVQSVIGPCHFMNGTGRDPIALTSFPGSGNTWMRGLLEQATGVCTGAVYSDFKLRISGLNGEGITSGGVLVVKTHYFENKMANNFSSAILVVRNPYNALVSEWTRIHSRNHTGTIREKYFGESNQWTSFIVRKIKVWQDHLTYWTTSPKPSLQIRYEDILDNALEAVKKMLDFLRFPYNHTKLEERMSRDYTKFKRTRRKDFEHFTHEQRFLIQAAISETILNLKKSNHGDSLGVEKYL